MFVKVDIIKKISHLSSLIVQQVKDPAIVAAVAGQRLGPAPPPPTDKAPQPKAEKSAEATAQRASQITSIDKDVEKREPLHIVGGNANWCSQYGRQHGCS